MMTRLVMILAAAGMALSTAIAGIGDWKNFTAMNSVRAVASSHDSVWAATSGGAFLYRLSDSTFVRFTNSEGLTTNDVTAIAIDRSGSVWFGQSDGSIDVLTPSTHTWRYVRDIATAANRTQKKIMSFALSGDSLYIATSFGVSLFSISRFEFIDTYANFGPLLIPPIVSVTTVNRRVYAATVKGIAVSKSDAVNLAAPESWEIYTSTGAISSLTVFQGAVAAAGTDGLFTFNGSSWIKSTSVLGPVSIVAQTDALLYLYYGSDGSIHSLAPGASPVLVGTALPSAATGGTIANGTLALATTSDGIAMRTQNVPSGWNLTKPNGPASNSFVSLAVDNNGVIWAASGQQNGRGFYSYNGTSWKNYIMANIDLNNSYAVAIGPNNSKWVSTWGGGLVLLNGAGAVQRIFNRITPGFIGTDANIENSYVVPAKIASDDAGNVWTSIYNSADRSKVVWRMKPDSTWDYFGAAQGDYRQMLGVLIDRNNTKWFTNAYIGFNPSGQRIVFLNETLNVSGTSDGWGMIPDANVASSSVTAAIEDRDGVIWLGTSIGIIVINDPLHPLTLTKVFLGAVRDQYINCIAVDAVNNKWIGTARGVFVVSPDGTSLIDQYTVANSDGKLVDDNVLSIAFDEKNGLAYFGTAKGLSSVGIQIVAPSADYSHITVYPNPFRPITPNDRVTIEGLAEGSTIKILTITGKLVKEFSAQGGGRAFWDGNTESGEPVASGIYLAAAYSENGSRVGSAKLAVIRR
ncbi:MAG TPA: two-component regulator propeller domain-containing protein [Bacteroidota bacterium]|nr:two-component regulator propeller domain-containing protein [Bacteroidota bacterium]